VGEKNIRGEKKNMRDFTHYSFKKMKVFDPNQELKGLSNEEIWPDSPTRISTGAAAGIVDRLIKLADSMNTPREEHSNTQHSWGDTQMPHHPEGRGRRQRGYQSIAATGAAA
jgi:hypothetical protein